MLRQSHSDPQGGSNRQTAQGGRSLWPPLAWLLLGALVLPGAWSSLNEEQEELLVELHNHYRGQVSPSASAMMPLVRRLQQTEPWRI